MTASHELSIYMISDSVGETANQTVRAALAQFPQMKDINTIRFPYVTTKDIMLPILEEARKVDAILVTTLVNEELQQFTQQYAKEHQLAYVELLSNIINHIQEKSDKTPLRLSGVQHQMDRDYLDRVDAMEFAVKYDDGKNLYGLKKADIVLLGVSRTSKTPLSMYLANKSYKVANLPLMPEVALPQQLNEVDPRRLIGLTASPDYLSKIRTKRISQLGLTENTQYNDFERIKNELIYANQVFDRYKVKMFNVEFKSIEETAASILDYMENL